MDIFMPLGHNTNPKDKANRNMCRICVGQATFSSCMPVLGMHLFSSQARKGHEMPMNQGALPSLPYYQCILQNHNKQG